MGNIDLSEMSVLALFVAVIGGLVAYVLGMAFGALTAVPLWGSIQLLIGIVLAVMLAKYGGVDEYNLFRFVILLGIVGFIGTIITTFVPVVAPFILAVGAFSVNGLVWAFVYILSAEAIKSRLM